MAGSWGASSSGVARAARPALARSTSVLRTLARAATERRSCAPGKAGGPGFKFASSAAVNSSVFAVRRPAAAAATSRAMRCRSFRLAHFRPSGSTWIPDPHVLSTAWSSNLSSTRQRAIEATVSAVPGGYCVTCPLPPFPPEAMKPNCLYRRTWRAVTRQAGVDASSAISWSAGVCFTNPILPREQSPTPALKAFLQDLEGRAKTGRNVGSYPR